MVICSEDCADFDLTPNPDGGCQPQIRKRDFAKLGFYVCSTALPSPMTCQNLEPLISSNAIVFTSLLTNATWADPTFEPVTIADCLSAIQYPTGRQFTAEDRIAVEVPADSGVLVNPFGDYAFWKNKKEASFYLGILFLYCDGTLEMPMDEKGKAMSGSLKVFRSQERQGSGDASFTLEIKKIEINFKGDPLQFEAPLIDVSTCPEISI